MELVKLSDIFYINYGNSYELNSFKQTHIGIAFVSRTEKNNGISGRINKINTTTPFPSGLITVALGGSVLSTFLQNEPFYTGFHIHVLKAKIDISDKIKLFYCQCIRENKYRYSYGRQANKTLPSLLVPSLESLPSWVLEKESGIEENLSKSYNENYTPVLNSSIWEIFKYEELFFLKKGKRLTKSEMKEGETPFIGAIEYENGLSSKIMQKPIHKKDTISVSYNGSIAESFYQADDYWASDDVNVLYPKFKINPYVAMFLNTLIKKEKFRYNYGRKWKLEQMKKSKIKLPVTTQGKPDWEFMENYIKSLPFSSQI